MDTTPPKAKRKRHETYRVGKVIVEKRPIEDREYDYNRPKDILRSTLKTS